MVRGEEGWKEGEERSKGGGGVVVVGVALLQLKAHPFDCRKKREKFQE